MFGSSSEIEDMVAINDAAEKTKPCDEVPHAKRKAKTLESEKFVVVNEYRRKVPVFRYFKMQVVLA